MDFNNEDPAYTGLSVYPANAATAAFEDGEFMLSGFDAKPVLVAGGSVKFYEVGENNAITLADSIEFADETQYMWALSDSAKTVKLPVKNQLVRVTDNAVYVTPHNGKIGYGKTYIVAISDGAITGKIDGVTFAGLTNNAANSKWKFTTRAKPTVGTAISVNNSQTASNQTFRSVQSALLAIGSTTGTYTVTIEPGTYYEPLYFDGSATVILHGNSTKDYSKGAEADVVISHANASLFTSAEKTRNVLTVISGNFVVENLSIVNSFDRAVWGKSDGQAECVGLSGGKGQTFAAYNCSFISHQDTIRTVGKSWFYKCYFEGDTDYLWQESDGVVMLVESCTLKNVYDANAGSATAYIVAPRMTIADSIGKGLVVLNSSITTAEGETAYFGRTPWNSGYYNQAAFIGNTITSGSGTFKAEWENAATSETVALNDGANVGWKFYNNTLDGTAIDTVKNATVMTAETFASEYNGRRAILNRLYNVKEKTYAKDTTSNWAIDEVITDGTARGWTVAEDASSETAAGEVVDTGIVFDFSTIKPNETTTKSGITYTPNSNVKYEGAGKNHAACTNGAQITLSGLTGNAYVTVTYYYQAKGTIESGSQSAVAFELKDGDEAFKSTSKFANTKYTHASGTKDVVIKCTGTTYITKIRVDYDDEIEDFKVPATGVTVNPTTASVVIDATTTISATVTPTDSTDSVVWSKTDGTGFVEITPNADGSVTVKGKTAGTATVTVTAGNFHADTTVTVSSAAVAATGVTLADKTVYVGDENVTLSATVTPADSTDSATYEVTEGTDVIGVAASTGAVTIKKAGTATVKVTSGTQTDTATITVKPNAIGQTYVLWAINNSGYVTADSATSTNGTTSDSAVTWTQLKYHDTSYGAKITGTESAPQTLSISVAGAAKVTWDGSSYSNGTIAVTALKEGMSESTSVVAATSAKLDTGGSERSAQGFLYTDNSPAVLTVTFTGTCYINNLKVDALADTDVAEVTSVEITPNTAQSISVGSNVAFTAKVYRNYLNADTTVTWKSTVEGKVSISNGTVTGVAAGDTQIKASAGEKTSTAVSVTVTAESLTDFSAKYVQTTIGGTVTGLTVTGSGGTGAVSYTSSATDVATVDPLSGAITVGSTAGYTTITATYGSTSKSYVIGVAPEASTTFTWSSDDFLNKIMGGLKGTDWTNTVGNFNGIYVDATASTSCYFKPWSSGQHIGVYSGCVLYIPVDTSKTTSITLNCADGFPSFKTVVSETETALVATNNVCTFNVVATGDNANVTTLSEAKTIGSGDSTLSVPAGSYVVLKAGSNGYIGKSANGITRSAN